MWKTPTKNRTCSRLCSVDSGPPLERWVASPFFWHTTLLRKRKMKFWNTCTIQKQGFGTGGNIPCVGLNCVALWIGKEKKAGSGPCMSLAKIPIQN